MEKLKKYGWLLLTALGSILGFMLLKPNTKKRIEKKAINNDIKKTDKEIEVVKEKINKVEVEKKITTQKIKKGEFEIKSTLNEIEKVNNTGTDVDKAKDHLNNIANK